MPGRDIVNMSKKKETQSNNKKAVRSSLERSAAVLAAFKRDILDPLELTIHPGQLTCDAILFPTFNPEVKS